MEYLFKPVTLHTGMEVSIGLLQLWLNTYYEESSSCQETRRIQGSQITMAGLLSLTCISPFQMSQISQSCSWLCPMIYMLESYHVLILKFCSRVGPGIAKVELVVYVFEFCIKSFCWFFVSIPSFCWLFCSLYLRTKQSVLLSSGSASTGLKRMWYEYISTLSLELMILIGT
jgi:hypothetical protein